MVSVSRVNSSTRLSETISSGDISLVQTFKRDQVRLQVIDATSSKVQLLYLPG